MTLKTVKPNPGTQEAIDAGCTCPVFDNAHGQGIILDGRVVFWYIEGCPMHWPIEEESDVEI